MSIFAAASSQPLAFASTASRERSTVHAVIATFGELVANSPQLLTIAKSTPPAARETRFPSPGSLLLQQPSAHAQTMLSFSCRLQAARIESELHTKIHFGNDTQPLAAALYVKEAGPALAVERERFVTLYKKTGNIALEILKFDVEPCLVSLRAPLRALLRTLDAENEAIDKDAQRVSVSHAELDRAADYIESLYKKPKPFIVSGMPFMGTRTVVVCTDREADAVVAFMNKCMDVVEEAYNIIEEVPMCEAEAYAKYLKHGDADTSP